MLLAAGVLGGADWLVNPLLGLVLLALTCRVAARVFGRAEGGLAVLLMAASSFFLDQSASFLSHVSCAVSVAAAFLTLLQWRRTGLGRELA